MSRVIFAENKRHADAMIDWLKLCPDTWHSNVYGGKLRKDYESAILVRPFNGVSPEHFVWISSVLAKVMPDPSKIIPLHWFYEEMPLWDKDDVWPEYTEISP